jgi:hypothetical protein
MRPETTQERPFLLAQIINAKTRERKRADYVFFKSDSKHDFSNDMFGQIRQERHEATEHFFGTCLFCCTSKEGGLGA